MSLTANRFATKPSQRISVPKVQPLSKDDLQGLSLLDRTLLQEHQRHAARLADIRAVADKLAALEDIVRTAAADGSVIDVSHVGLSISRYSEADDSRGVHAVVLRERDSLLSGWRKPQQQNALVNALLCAGWRIVFVHAEGSTLSLDRVVLMHGRRAVETTCMRQWVLNAIDAGLITANTQGRHPAKDTGTPLNTGRAAAHAATDAAPAAPSAGAHA